MAKTGRPKAELTVTGEERARLWLRVVFPGLEGGERGVGEDGVGSLH